MNCLNNWNFFNEEASGNYFYDNIHKKEYKIYKSKPIKGIVLELYIKNKKEVGNLWKL